MFWKAFQRQFFSESQAQGRFAFRHSCREDNLCTMLLFTIHKSEEPILFLVLAWWFIFFVIAWCYMLDTLPRWVWFLSFGFWPRFLQKKNKNNVISIGENWDKILFLTILLVVFFLLSYFFEHHNIVALHQSSAFSMRYLLFFFPFFLD